jgi:hypothetical protein
MRRIGHLIGRLIEVIFRRRHDWRIRTGGWGSSVHCPVLAIYCRRCGRILFADRLRHWRASIMMSVAAACYNTGTFPGRCDSDGFALYRLAKLDANDLTRADLEAGLIVWNGLSFDDNPKPKITAGVLIGFIRVVDDARTGGIDLDMWRVEASDADGGRKASLELAKRLIELGDL